jgi:hypothetical protein
VARKRRRQPTPDAVAADVLWSEAAAPSAAAAAHKRACTRCQPLAPHPDTDAAADAGTALASAAAPHTRTRSQSARAGALPRPPTADAVVVLHFGTQGAAQAHAPQQSKGGQPKAAATISAPLQHECHLLAATCMAPDSS